MNIAQYVMNKDNKAMKFVQVIKYKNGSIFFSKIMQKMRQGD